MTELIEFPRARYRAQLRGFDSFSFADRERAALRVEAVEWKEDTKGATSAVHEHLLLSMLANDWTDRRPLYIRDLLSAVTTRVDVARQERPGLSRTPDRQIASVLRYESRIPWLGFSLYYRSLWIILAVAGIVWGVLSGVAFATGAGIGIPGALTGLTAIVGLVCILFFAGRDQGHR